MDENSDAKSEIEVLLLKSLSEVWSCDRAGKTCRVKFKILIFLLIDNFHIRELNFSYSSVEVQVVLIFYKVQIVLIFTAEINPKDTLVSQYSKFFPLLLGEVDVPGPDQVGVEAGEAVPGRTDGHVRKYQVRDGEGLDGGGDRAGGPTGQGLLDQDASSDEATDYDTDPEESDIAASVGDIAQAVNGGGLQELLDYLHAQTFF